MTIIEALVDPMLFGALPVFRDLSSWRHWLVLLCAVDGTPLSTLQALGISEAEALTIWREHTGRITYDPPRGGWPEIVVVGARQIGKTTIGGVIGGHAAVTSRAGEARETVALCVSQDQRASTRTMFAAVAAPFDASPVLHRSVRDRRSDALVLTNGCTITAYPCRPQAARGLVARIVILDELAFFRSSEGYALDVEMLRAVRPCLATTNGKLVILSSPYGQTGALFDLFRKHWGREDDQAVLVWRGSAPSMNPLLSQRYFDRMHEDDPEGYASEVLAEFRSGVATFLDPDTVQECVADGVRERAPQAGVRYFGYMDAASGSGQDSFAVAISHREGDRAVQDVCRAWPPPFNPSGVIEEACDLLKQYGLREATGDRFAPGFVSEACRSHGVAYKPHDKDTSAVYLELLPIVNSGRAVLLDQSELLRELRTLERRRGTSGRDRVDHRPGAHDDRAVASAGALTLAAARRQEEMLIVSLFDGSVRTASQVARERRAAELGLPLGDPFLSGDPLRRGRM